MGMAHSVEGRFPSILLVVCNVFRPGSASPVGDHYSKSGAPALAIWQRPKRPPADYDSSAGPPAPRGVLNREDQRRLFHLYAVISVPGGRGGPFLKPPIWHWPDYLDPAGYTDNSLPGFHDPRRSGRPTMSRCASVDSPSAAASDSRAARRVVCRSFAICLSCRRAPQSSNSEAPPRSPAS
jgi:hypothetical protein